MSDTENSATKLSATKKLPEIKLSNKLLNLLEDLLLEGDLLETNMDECHQIWKLLQATEPRRSRKYPDLHKLEVELETAREEKLRAKKKRKLEAATAASEAKKVKTEGEPQAQENGKKRKGRARKKESVDDSEDNDEEQEDCSAKPKCSRPVGKEVHWVQCDGCELWLHLTCIGLKPEQVSEDEDFICRDCKPPNSKKPKASK